eukprot:TRINITY_DN4813_c0_g1_i1.p2 TRINITY_DN4813_c0_g1~~TRINITY_DN4813_c0_g1_i1.p2  ORF type:complete len:105 (-),score=3.42 TRINITY_DN4813_c0_g1_i1:301-615(-)
MQYLFPNTGRMTMFFIGETAYRMHVISSPGTVPCLSLNAQLNAAEYGCEQSSHGQMPVGAVIDLHVHARQVRGDCRLRTSTFTRRDSSAQRVQDLRRRPMARQQ